MQGQVRGAVKRSGPTNRAPPGGARQPPGWAPRRVVGVHKNLVQPLLNMDKFTYEPKHNCMYELSCPAKTGSTWPWQPAARPPPRPRPNRRPPAACPAEATPGAPSDRPPVRRLGGGSGNAPVGSVADYPVGRQASGPPSAAPPTALPAAPPPAPSMPEGGMTDKSREMRLGPPEGCRLGGWRGREGGRASRWVAASALGCGRARRRVGTVDRRRVAPGGSPPTAPRPPPCRIPLHGLVPLLRRAPQLLRFFLAAGGARSGAAAATGATASGGGWLSQSRAR